MKKLRLAALLLTAAALLCGCSDDYNDDPFVRFKDASGNTISATENIPVELNSTVRVYVEIGFLRFNDNYPNYDWKIDDGDYVQYSMYDGLNITTIGYYNNLNLAKATMDITFSDEKMQPGSVVTIRITDQGTLSRTLSFVVEAPPVK